MPLAERLLDLFRGNGYAVKPKQNSARVPLAGLLEVVGVRIGRSWSWSWSWSWSKEDVGPHVPAISAERLCSGNTLFVLSIVG